jgi:hypothetical protein
MKEIFIIYLWESKLLKSELQTTDGEHVEIYYPGLRNYDAGPDFSNARLKIGQTEWAGNVEIHLNASDWYKHNHQSDKAYNNVVLHVVYNADKDVYRTNRQKIPCLEIKGRFDENILLKYRSFIDSKHWVACENLLGSVQKFTWLAWLDRVIAERLESKTQHILSIFEKSGNDWEETFYRRLLKNFGFHVNDMTFEQLAHSMSFNLLLRHADQQFQLEALLFGQSGMLQNEFSGEYPKNLQQEYRFLASKYELKPMDSASWRFMRMRPPNFPTIRLAQLAAMIHTTGRLFSRILAAEQLDDIRNLFRVSASAYWDNHFRFDKPSKETPKQIGEDTIDLLIINTVVQLTFAYGFFTRNEKYTEKALLLLESLPAENNQVTRKFGAAGLKVSNALQSQALLHLKAEYCNPKRCLDCRIGSVLIKNSES